MAGLLQKDGHNVLSSVPKEGAVIWTESACIVTGTKKADLAKAFIRYLVSPEGQRRLMLKTSYMASGPSKIAWENLNKADPKMAKVLRMDLNGENLLSDWRGDRLVLRQLPTQQSPEDWQEAWSKFQNM
jgi:spermidine/putrescine transport system substrate-binding protein